MVERCGHGVSEQQSAQAVDYNGQWLPASSTTTVYLTSERLSSATRMGALEAAIPERSVMIRAATRPAGMAAY